MVRFERTVFAFQGRRITTFLHAAENARQFSERVVAVEDVEEWSCAERSVICYGFLVIFTCQLQQQAPVTVCPQIHAWSKAYQLQLASEIERMPADSATARAMREHVQMRDRARKCRRGR